ncbi:MAG: hypothetical protein ACLFPX_03355 [Candidatus Omnitrophota bacterium]
MADDSYFQKEWPKIRKQLMTMSKEAVDLAKKGEEQLVKFSKKGKLQLDSTTINLKLERLYYQIGKEYVRAKYPAQKTPKLEKLVKDLNELKKEERRLKKRIKSSPKKTSSKRSKKKS